MRGFIDSALIVGAILLDMAYIELLMWWEKLRG